MTKLVRIENADTAPYNVLVQTWDKGRTLGDGTAEPDILVKEEILTGACDITEPFTYITATRYLVVKEA